MNWSLVFEVAGSSFFAFLQYWQIEYSDMYQLLIIYRPKEKLITKVQPVMSTFSAFAKRAEPESRIWQWSAKSQVRESKQLTEIFCSNSDTCIMASGNEGDN